MISSMTSYVQMIDDSAIGRLVWDIRSVNQRYFELNIRVPESIREIQDEFRTRLAKALGRGKVEAYCRFIPGESSPERFHLNHDALAQLASLKDELEGKLGKTEVEFSHMINWPGLIETKMHDVKTLQAASLELLDKAIEKMQAIRQKEGEGIKVFLSERLVEIETSVQKIESQLPIAIEAQEKNIRDKFEKLQIELDSDRIAQEMVWLVQKTDIAEEVQRLRSHVDAMRDVIAKGGACGKRLDFLLQELNREANTTASKAFTAEISHLAVGMKVAIEQMREQVQNIV